jgi:hypothetical protein
MQRHLWTGVRIPVRNLMCITERRRAPVIGARVLLAAAFAAAALLASGTAQAAACGPATPAGTPCTLSGTLGVTAGTLALTSPVALAWSATANGLDQQLADTSSAHQSYLVTDSSTAGAGWHVTVSATTFTSGASTLANAGTFLTNGSITAEAATTAPTASCGSLSTCTLPARTTVYPVAITTAASAPASFTICNAGLNTGLGTIQIGVGANPVGWWVNVPAKALAGTYTSTVSLQIVSGP